MNEVLLSSILCKFFRIGCKVSITFDQVVIRVDGLSEEDIKFINRMLKPL